MKKFWIIAILSTVAFSCQKPKEQPTPTPTPTPTPLPTPPPVKYTITITVGKHGTISGEYGIVSSSDSTTNIQPGSNVSYIITANTGYNINQIDVNGVNILTGVITGPYQYDFTKINANYSLSVGFTDSLTVGQLDSMNNAILGTWYFSTDSLGETDTVLKKLQQLGYLSGDSSVNRVWVSYQPIPQCFRDVKFIFTKDSVKEYAGAHPCDTTPPNTLYGSWDWKISPDGKNLTSKDKTGASTNRLFSLTSTKWEWADTSQIYNGGYWLKYTMRRNINTSYGRSSSNTVPRYSSEPLKSNSGFIKPH
ncbi:MAG: hypothetical protein KGI58_03380 [Patescibacteria group bacterium]|nr:hypothetical protein [Patescibacteria group bacterium]